MLRSTLLALVLALSACGVSPSDYYARLAASYCEELARCGGIGESEQLRCEVVQIARSARSLAELEEAVGAGRLAIDAGALSRCLNAAETSSCSAPRRDCSSAFVGRVKAGGACRNTGECTVGACEVAKGRCFGLCRAPTGAAVGQPCSDTHPCLVDRTCFNGVCGHLAMVGQYCGDYKDCMPSLSCIDSRCRAAGKDVDPCTGFLCEAPLFCDSGATPPTCKAHAPLPGPSEPCAWSQECRKGYACTARRELPGQCLSWLDVGQSCDPATSRCPRSMWCSLGMDAMSAATPQQTCPAGVKCRGICKSLQQLAGETCLQRYGVEGGGLYHYCRDVYTLEHRLVCDSTNTCRDPFAVGQPCASYEECISLECNLATHTCKAEDPPPVTCR